VRWSVVCLVACGATTPVAAPDAGDAPSDGGPGFTMIVDGVERFTLFHIPPVPANPAPLVLELHPSGGTAATQQALADIDGLADAEGFVVAYPQGIIPLWGGFQWHVPDEPLVDGTPTPPTAPDDVAYIAAVIRAVSERVAIDPHRIYATGFSGGARMTSQLGCTIPEIAAIAPIAGVRYPAPCDLARPASVIALHGTADMTNPFDGNGAVYWSYSVPEAMQRWATHDGCAIEPTVTQVAPTATRSDYSGCAAGVTVELYALAGEDHAWPRAVDANAVIWAAFRDHPR
jgi:polyhydroxybutyrate depolymerase